MAVNWDDAIRDRCMPPSMRDSALYSGEFAAVVFKSRQTHLNRAQCRLEEPAIVSNRRYPRASHDALPPQRFLPPMLQLVVQQAVEGVEVGLRGRDDDIAVGASAGVDPAVGGGHADGDLA